MQVNVLAPASEETCTTMSRVLDEDRGDLKETLYS